MGTLTPKAFAELYRQMIDAAKKDGSFYKTKNDLQFGKSK